MFINDRTSDSRREQDISFTPDDCEVVVPHDDDPMVVTLQIHNWDVKRVLIDPGSSANILYYDAFERLGLAPEQLQTFKGILTGFTDEQVHVRGYVTLKTTFRSGENAKTIKVKYLVINAPKPPWRFPIHQIINYEVPPRERENKNYYRGPEDRQGMLSQQIKITEKEKESGIRRQTIERQWKRSSQSKLEEIWKSI